MGDSNIDQQLRDRRPEPTAIELDRMKLLALDRAMDRGRSSRAAGILARSRLAPVILAFALLLGSMGTLMASGVSPTAVTGFTQANSARHQYCPPKSKPKHKPGDRKGGKDEKSGKKGKHDKCDEDDDDDDDRGGRR